MSLFLALLLLSQATPASSSFSDCYSICAYGMSDACCSCIGCDQSMRFGKRSDNDAKQARWLLRGRGYGKKSALDPTPSDFETDGEAADFGNEINAKLYSLERLIIQERLRRQRQQRPREFMLLQ
uniref:Uncharacterized protein n=1 Tax=Plectus sambesii TaxID=2011161 RepID=A0A914X176_9BILA